MNDTILAAIISVGGAVISAVLASFGTIYLRDIKEKNKLKNIVKTMIILIEDSYINNYNCISEDYDSLFNTINNIDINNLTILSIGNYNLKSLELRDLFKNSDLTEIFLKIKDPSINVNILLLIEDNLKTINNNSPKKLIENFVNELSANKQNLNITNDIKEHFKDQFNHYKSFSNDNIEFYNKILIELKKL